MSEQVRLVDAMKRTMASDLASARNRARRSAKTHIRNLRRALDRLEEGLSSSRCTYAINAIHTEQLMMAACAYNAAVETMEVLAVAACRVELMTDKEINPTREERMRAEGVTEQDLADTRLLRPEEL